MILSMLTGGGEVVPKFKHGTYTNYASVEDRRNADAYNYNQRAKGGRVGYGGLNSQAAGDPGFQLSYLDAAHKAGTLRPGFGSSGLMGGSGGLGWTPQNALQGLNFRMENPRIRGQTKENYPLGRPSEAFYNKFSRWGANGPTGNKGWQGTLTQSPGSRSTFAPSQMFKDEVFQTREVRRKHGLKPWIALPKHAESSRLNPNLAYMFQRKNIELGAVRRSARRLV